jgi:PAS domain S-box-containing protein
MTMRNKFLSLLHHPITAWAILLCSFLLTWIAWRISNQFVIQRASDRFTFHTDDIQAAISRRMIEYEEVLRGGVGLFVASEKVTRQEWHQYVQTLQIDDYYPGIQGIGFSIFVPPEGKKDHTLKIRAEGFPNYKIWPEGVRSEYHSIIYLEPFQERNLRAFGYDMYSEPVRHAAMTRARDTGLPSISGIVTLVQETETDIQKGFLMYLPVYRNGEPHETLEERRRSFVGFVYSPFRVKDFMHGVLGTATAGIDFEIFDGEPSNQETLLYDSNETFQGDDPHHHPQFSRILPLQLKGREWRIYYHTGPRYIAQAEASQPLVVAVGGVLVDLLLFYIIASLGKIQKKATIMAEEMAAAAREKSVALENAVEGIVSLDPQRRYLDVNRAYADIVGYLQSEMIGKKWPISVFPEDYPKVEAAYREMLAKGRAEMEVGGKHKDGSIFYQHAVLVRSSDPQNAFVGSYCFLKDITERKILQEQLQRKNKELEEQNRQVLKASRLKSEFLANMSHELRTPLNGVIGFTEFLRSKKPGPLNPKQEEYLGDILSSGRHLLRLINDILDLAKIESGKMEVSPETFSCREAINEVCAVLGPIARKKGMTIETKVADVDRVILDPRKFRQILYNLLSNAVKFSHEGSAVEVSLRPYNGNEIRLEVKDQGIGIKQEDVEAIFAKFTQIDSGAARYYEGTGLGLALTKELVELQRGSIGVDSEFGKGSTFTVILPANLERGI